MENCVPPGLDKILSIIRSCIVFSQSILAVLSAYELRHDKTNKMSVRPVWSESSLSAWGILGSLATH